MNPRRIFRLSSVLAAAAVFAVGCYTVPETGRRSLNLVGDSELAVAAHQQFEQMKQELKISTNRAHLDQVGRVGKRIAEAVGDEIESPEWEFVVFDDEQVNAFAMPGGKVGVFKGLIDLVESDDELAAVVGHEIAHVIARHGNERYSQAMLTQLGAVGLGVALGDQSEMTQQLAMTAYGVGAQVGVLLRYSRHHESEADHMGLIYMARAGYDPRAALSFWEKMSSKSGGGAPPEFLSTHPHHGTRIERLRELMPEALEEYNRNKR